MRSSPCCLGLQPFLPFCYSILGIFALRGTWVLFFLGAGHWAVVVFPESPVTWSFFVGTPVFFTADFFVITFSFSSRFCVSGFAVCVFFIFS